MFYCVFIICFNIIGICCCDKNWVKSAFAFSICCCNTGDELLLAFVFDVICCEDGDDGNESAIPFFDF